jgi:hypothetical protein
LARAPNRLSPTFLAIAPFLGIAKVSAIHWRHLTGPDNR